jgi:hypothetical protein
MEWKIKDILQGTNGNIFMVKQCKKGNVLSVHWHEGPVFSTAYELIPVEKISEGHYKVITDGEVKAKLCDESDDLLKSAKWIDSGDKIGFIIS